jgi:molybdate transport system ATP-binding protein
MNNKPIITLDDITVRLRDKTYLRNTSWQINSGENWAVLGPNGAGKTTLARSLFGGVPVVGGRIIHHEHDPNGASVWDVIGYVSPEQHRQIVERENLQLDSRDFSGNIDEITTVEDIILGRTYSQDPDNTNNRHRLSGVARRLQLQSILNRNILSISSGEMTKILIARALMKKPRLLVLDEPFDGLDRQSRRALKKVIEELMADKIQIILITHRFDEIMADISHVLFLKDGCVYLSGRKQDIINDEIINDIYELEENSLLDSFNALKPFYGADDIRQSAGSASNGDAPGRVLIEMKNTTVRYKEVVVLDNINWTVKQGENWMILGPNGAGKTTTLKLVLGENLQAYANEIYLFGRKKGSGENVWEIKKNIGFISSELQARYPKHVSVFDVICSGFFDSFGLYRLCSDAQKDIARAWTSTLGLDPLADQKFEQLSHGQRQLALIARAMVKSPVLLMLDEPCDGLDISNRTRLLEILEYIGDNTDTNLVYVTHHEEESLACITNVLKLDRGKVVDVQTVRPVGSLVEQT